jgi:hypothetical protein
MVNFVMRGDVGDFVPQSTNFPQKEKKISFFRNKK